VYKVINFFACGVRGGVWGFGQAREGADVTTWVSECMHGFSSPLLSWTVLVLYHTFCELQGKIGVSAIVYGMAKSKKKWGVFVCERFPLDGSFPL
jgi:hypothetical protein